jgi:predicted nucleic acid-binding protein
MNHSIFLDTDIFFECIESPKLETVIEHALNIGYEMHTSISVLGEGFTQMNDKENASDYILALNRYLDDWEIAVHFPNDYVRTLCYLMGQEEIDTRMIREPTDRTHLAYAMAYNADYFLTSDKNLTMYRVPAKIQEKGFFKPKTMKLEAFSETVLNVYR